MPESSGDVSKVPVAFHTEDFFIYFFLHAIAAHHGNYPGLNSRFCFVKISIKRLLSAGGGAHQDREHPLAPRAKQGWVLQRSGDPSPELFRPPRHTFSAMSPLSPKGATAGHICRLPSFLQPAQLFLLLWRDIYHSVFKTTYSFRENPCTPFYFKGNLSFLNFWHHI